MAKCPECGGTEIDEVTVYQDIQGNDLRAIVCANPDCDYVYVEQDTAQDCLHLEYEKDEIERYWCADCGAYLGEWHSPFDHSRRAVRKADDST